MQNILVHGTWLVDRQQVFLWAEGVTITPRRGRRAAVPRHPAQCPPESWLPALTSSAAIQASLAPHTATVWLPATPDAPLPPPELIAMGAEPPPPDVPITLSPWRVAGVLAPLAVAPALLLSLPRTTALQIAPDLSAWHLAMVVALDLLAGQQVLPTLTRDGGALRAGWQVAPTPATASTIGRLARALPPLCRAIVADPDAALSARAILDDFLAAVVTATMRSLPVRPSLPATAPGGRWLAALRGPDPRVLLAGNAGDDLYRRWTQWVQQGQAAGTDRVRITFRLEAPDQPDGSWRLTYLLQATDDPSLLVPAALIWQDAGAAVAALGRRFDQPHERLLAGLGAAARLCPAIADSLRQATPDHAVLTAPAAYAFLTEAALVLEQSGFGVLVPAWWGSRATRLTTRLRARGAPATNQRSVLSLDTLVQFDWEVALAGAPLTRQEFERIVSLKQPLVQIRGQWVVLDPAQLDQALAVFAQPAGTLPMGDLVTLHLAGHLPDGAAGAATEVVAEGWLGAVLATLADQQPLAPLPPPAGLHAQLRPYQAHGYAWLTVLARCGLGACLADDMGLGKTLQTIAALLAAREADPAAAPALVVCPTSVVGAWRRELAQFAPTLRVLVHRGADRLAGAAFHTAVQAADIVLTSYPLLARDQALLQAVVWSSVVLDEAQTIKNAATRQAQAATSLRAGHRIALTGTPVENRLSDLWSIMAFLNPGYLGSQAHFQRTFARPIERTGDAQATARLRHLTAPFILRRLKTDRTIIDDLPEKLETRVACGLTNEQVTLYAAVVREALAEIEGEDGAGIRRRGLVLAMLTKLKQICNHPALFVQDGSPLAARSGKVARLTELLEEIIASDGRALLFTQFATFGAMLQAHLRATLDTEVLFLHGGTPARDRDGLVRQFQAPAGPRLMLLSLKAGGTGLTLTAANHVFHLDRWWNPAVETQATDRAFRIGQQRTVQVHTFICGGTLEDQIDQLIQNKRALADRVLGSGEGWLTELTTDQLRAVVTLRSELLEEVA